MKQALIYQLQVALYLIDLSADHLNDELAKYRSRIEALLQELRK